MFFKIGVLKNFAKLTGKHLSPWTQGVNWTYIRRSEDVQDIFWTPYVRSIYVLCPGGFQSLFLIKLQAPATLLKKRLWHRCFPVNFTKSIRTPFLRNISGSCFLSIPQATPKLSCGEYEYIYLEPKNCFAHENCVINSVLSWRKVVLKMSAKFLKNTCKGVLFSI